MTDLAPLIEHTLLAPEAEREAVLALCAEARTHRFGGVCIAPDWVETAAGALRGSDVRIVTVCGFPHGNTMTDAKVAEASAAVAAGAADVDMVVKLGRLKAGQDDAVADDIRAVAQAVHAAEGARLKVILEIAKLGEEDIRRGSALAQAAGADFVKTSTGFGGGGATVEAVRLMRASVGPSVRIKAAGGIRDAATARAMIAAGADVLGCSASVAIVRED